MDATTLAQFRKRLEEMETELRQDLESKTNDTAPVPVDSSIGRLSRMDAIQAQQLAVELKARQQQALLRTQSALQAIRSGTYGHCRRCKNPITMDRLEAQPDAVLCVDCASQSGR